MPDVQNYGTLRTHTCVSSQIISVPDDSKAPGSKSDLVLIAKNDADNENLTTTFHYAATPTLSFATSTSDNDIVIKNLSSPENSNDAVNSDYIEHLLGRAPAWVIPTTLKSWGTVPFNATPSTGFRGRINTDQTYWSFGDEAAGFAFINIPINDKKIQYFEFDVISRGTLGSGAANTDRINIILGVINKESYHDIDATVADWVSDGTNGMAKAGSDNVVMLWKIQNSTGGTPGATSSMIYNSCSDAVGGTNNGHIALKECAANNDSNGWLNQGLKIQCAVNLAERASTGGSMEFLCLSGDIVKARQTITGLSFSPLISKDYYFMVALAGGQGDVAEASSPKIYNSAFSTKLGYYAGTTAFSPAVYIQ